MSQQRELTRLLAKLYKKDALAGIDDSREQVADMTVLSIVADIYCCHIKDIQSNARSFRQARFTAAALLHAVCGYTYSRIGYSIRPRYPTDHTSVIYWIKNVTKDARYDEAHKRVCAALGVDNEYTG